LDKRNSASLRLKDIQHDTKRISAAGGSAIQSEAQ